MEDIMECDISASAFVGNYDLDEIVDKIPNAKKTQSGVKINVPNFNKPILFHNQYSSTYFLVENCKTIDDVKSRTKEVILYFSKYFSEDFKRFDMNKLEYDIKIEKWDVKDSLGFNIDLESLIPKINPDVVSYDFDKSYGLKIKNKELEFTITVFKNGNFRVTGFKNRDVLFIVEEFKNFINQIIND